MHFSVLPAIDTHRPLRPSSAICRQPTLLAGRIHNTLNRLRMRRNPAPCIRRIAIGLVRLTRCHIDARFSMPCRRTSRPSRTATGSFCSHSMALQQQRMIIRHHLPVNARSILRKVNHPPPPDPVHVDVRNLRLVDNRPEGLLHLQQIGDCGEMRVSGCRSSPLRGVTFSCKCLKQYSSASSSPRSNLASASCPRHRAPHKDRYSG